MLHQVLSEIKNARGPITVSELSRKLGIQPAALEGMIEFWVRKGRLQRDDQEIGESCSCGAGESHCAPVSSCVSMPKAYVYPTRS